MSEKSWLVVGDVLQVDITGLHCCVSVNDVGNGRPSVSSINVTDCTITVREVPVEGGVILVIAGDSRDAEFTDAHAEAMWQARSNRSGDTGRRNQPSSYRVQPLDDRTTFDRGREVVEINVPAGTLVCHR